MTITPSHPSAEVRRQSRAMPGLLPWLIVFAALLCVIYGVSHMPQLPIHPDCPTAAC